MRRDPAGRSNTVCAVPFRPTGCPSIAPVASTGNTSRTDPEATARAPAAVAADETREAQDGMWLRHSTSPDDGRLVDRRLAQRTLDVESGRAPAELATVPGAARRLEDARRVVEDATSGAGFPAFATTRACARHLVVLAPPTPAGSSGSPNPRSPEAPGVGGRAARRGLLQRA